MADVIVVGAGVVGAACAWQLAARGRRVTLLDAAHPATGASGAADGWVRVQGKRPGAHARLARLSRALLEELDAAEGSFDFRRTHCLMVLEDERQAAFADAVTRAEPPHVAVERLSPAEARRLEPALTGPFVAADHALAAQVNPIKLNATYICLARRRGAAIRYGEAATALVVRSGRVTGVRTTRGTHPAAVVVLANGFQAPNLAATAGVRLSIRPERSQLAVTAPRRSLVRGLVLCACYLAGKYGPREHAGGAILEQAWTGGILVGITQEDAANRRATVPALPRMLGHAVRLVPALANAPLVRAWAAVTPRTPDGLPLIGPIPGLDGLIVAGGHSQDGISLSAATGRLVAALIAGEDVGEELAAFAPDRFGI